MKSVSVLTRTFEREGLLERAMRSLLAQTYDDWVWVVIDASQSHGTAGQLSGQPQLDGRLEVVRIHNSEMLGAHLNTGINKVDSRYVVVLDDDDTWEPSFLQSMVSKLETQSGGNVRGAVCGFRTVFEARREGSSDFAETGRLESPMHSVNFADASLANPFCNNAFLYDRAVLQEIGLYADDYPVLEDWHFNLRFLSRFDVVCVPDILANSHVRRATCNGTDANLTFERAANLEFYKRRLLNEQLRAALAAGMSLAASALAGAQLHAVIDKRLQEHLVWLDAIGETIGKVNSRTKVLKDSLLEKRRTFRI